MWYDNLFQELERSISDNIWLKRIAIDFQQKYKEQLSTLSIKEASKYLQLN